MSSSISRSAALAAGSQTSLSPTLQRALVGQVLVRSFKHFSIRAFEELQGSELEPTWHLDAIARVLMQIESGELRRVLITLPPRSLKSHMISVAFPAWLMGRNPSLKIIATSYGEELAVLFANEWRRLLGAQWYQSAFPSTRITHRKDREGETHLTQGGHRLSVSAGGQLTGRGADIIIVDDPLKAAEAHSQPTRTRINDWFGQTLLSRLNDKRTGAIVVVMQRLHIDDLAGKLINEGGWHHLNLPAIAPMSMQVPLLGAKSYQWRVGEPLQNSREPIEVLDQVQRSMGAASFSAQYLQNPIPTQGNMIGLKYFQRFDPTTLRSRGHKTVISIDTANSGGASSDFSVIQTWQQVENNYYLVDMLRGRWDYPELKATVERLSAGLRHPRILIEEAGIAFGLTKELRASGCNCSAIKPRESKEQRVSRILPIIESERIFLPLSADWLDAFQAEIAAFPSGKHDDQVDAMSQFLNWAARQLPPDFKLPPIRVISQ